jgi:hypothetical protein
MEDGIMLKVRFYHFFVSGKAAATFRIMMILAILISALVFTGTAAAGPTPGGVGS